MNNLIFVGGYPRSGTSRLRDVLGTHPHIYSIPIESDLLVGHGLLYVVDMFNRTEGVKARNNALDAFVAYANKERADWWVRTWIESGGVAGDFQGLVDTFASDVRRDFGAIKPLARQFIIDFLSIPDNGGKPYLCEKTPNTYLYMPTLWSLMPDAKFIHITRDPRNVFVSFYSQPWAATKGDMVGTNRALKWGAEKWAPIKNICQADRRYYTVKLENLCDNPKAEMDKITDFIGCVPCDWPDDCFSWKETSSDWEAFEQGSVVDRYCKPYMELMGYE